MVVAHGKDLPRGDVGVFYSISSALPFFFFFSSQPYIVGLHGLLTDTFFLMEYSFLWRNSGQKEHCFFNSVQSIRKYSVDVSSLSTPNNYLYDTMGYKTPQHKTTQHNTIIRMTIPTNHTTTLLSAASARAKHVAGTCKHTMNTSNATSSFQLTPGRYRTEAKKWKKKNKWAWGWV